VLLWVELPWKKVDVSKRKQASRVFVLAMNHPIRPTPVNSEQAKAVQNNDLSFPVVIVFWILLLFLFGGL
jgi:hypothetical protein